MRFLLLLILLVSLVVKSAEITPGFTFTDGQRLTAAQLGQLVSLATINTAFYNNKVSQGSPAAGDVFLCYSASSGTFHKLTANDLIYQNYGIISSQTPYNVTPSYSTFLFYDPSNAWFGQMTISNLSRQVSGGIVASNLVFGTTNGPSLPLYPKPLNPGNTNNQLLFVVFDTNGIPNYTTWSNILTSAYSYVYTNYQEPLVYQQIYTPWTIYGTNQTTNIWGKINLFAITNLFMFGNTSNQTVSASDAFPVFSTQQGSNTTVTLGTIGQYIQTNNLLPNYTQARVTFSGFDSEVLFTNSASFGSPAYEVSCNASGNPFATNSVKAFIFLKLPNGNFPSTTPQIGTNQVYYGVSSRASPAARFLIFTNYSDGLGYIATTTTNAVLVNSTGTATNQIATVPQFTSFASDVTPATLDGISVLTGAYDIWFRTGTITTNYYVSGIATPVATGNSMQLAYAFNSVITTNRVRVDTRNAGGTRDQSTRVSVLISPE